MGTIDTADPFGRLETPLRRFVSRDTVTIRASSADEPERLDYPEMSSRKDREAARNFVIFRFALRSGSPRDPSALSSRLENR